ncbi:MAG: PAS domain S-box protein [Ferruginibacter sp.]|nr:PAS domain S-box protein [Ferruginibacter sp.]
MSISIKNRIYLSFLLLVLLFVANGISSMITLNNNRRLSEYVSTVTNPSLRSLDDFRDLVSASKMYTSNWVFLRSNQDDKDALKRIHNIEYAQVKAKLELLSQKWNDKEMTDSLHRTYTGFEQLLVVEKTIMSLLEKFEDYDDPVAKLEAERLVEDELVPNTSLLMKALSGLFSYELNLRNQKNSDLDKSFMHLRWLISFLAITIIFLGIFLSFYMARVIISPVNKIRDIVNDLGNGITSKVTHRINNDEMGEMIRSVNNLSEKLHGTAAFATEIGNRNFNSYFEPLGTEDTLGKALVAMRDNLKTSDESLNESQHHAKLGSWERNLATNKSFWSDEIYNILDIETTMLHPGYGAYLDFVHPEDREYANRFVEKCLENHLPFAYECRIITNKKITKIVSTQGKIFKNDNGEIIKLTGIVQDITERKNAEAKLNKSEEQYRQIVEIAQEGIWLIDENNYTTFVNKRMCEMLEYSPEEMVGKQNYYFKNEEEKKNALKQIERRKQGISETHDANFMTKTGKLVWTSVTTNPVFDEAGTYKGALAMFTDITKRKHDEELLQISKTTLALNNQLLEQKNKELEQFAYVASHDLQEPLRTTISFVEIFKQQYFGKIDPKADKYLTYIMQATDRMRVLIKDLLDFSRIGNNKDLEQVDCDSLLRDVIADIETAIVDSNANICAADLPVISGYATEIKQLFQNLLINAIKFRKPGEIPQIKISADKSGSYWHFAFADNGIGIDKKHNERIFIIFQRLHTRTEYDGSGIGLSHCKKIVELHHGKIWVESVPGEGSVFHFTIET